MNKHLHTSHFKYLCIAIAFYLGATSFSTQAFMSEHSNALSNSIGAQDKSQSARHNNKKQAATKAKLKVTSSKQAANLAKSKFNAKVLSVTASQSRSGPIYRVKMLSNKGVVFYALVYAQSGRVVRG